MKDEEFIKKMIAYFNDTMPQLGGICIQDFANVNDIACEITRREKLPKITTLQQVVDIVAAHARKQGESSSNEGNCRYRDSQGRKCWVGSLILDEHYLGSLEKASASADGVVLALVKSGVSVELTQMQDPLDDRYTALVNLQITLHDEIAEYVGDEFLREFESALILYCKERNLTYPPLEVPIASN